MSRRKAKAEQDAPSIAHDGVMITWHSSADQRRFARVGDILLAILDNPTTPGEPEKP